MASPVSDSKPIEFADMRRKALSGPEKGIPDLQQLKFQLGNALQSSLDLEQVLSTFLSELGKIINSEGLRYLNAINRLEYNLGRRCNHSCSYKIITQLDHLGELIIYRSRRFQETELAIIEEVLGMLICPLRNALSYREAVIASLTDPLTGAGNRIAMENSLTREMELARRHKSSFSILLLDVDDFKKLNDDFGHSAGDAVLISIVNCLKQVNRRTDLCFRFGGEEFVVLLNETSLKGAAVIAERFRRTIEDSPALVESAEIRSTVSIGATCMRANDTKKSLFSRADEAMYKAKSRGKNQVVSLP